ncbi:MAG: hypothetical protein IPK68_15295 [Bdellovibrionales bacterium]|nr:hypothetical protein [Bdellovibrionales bacterium]
MIARNVSLGRLHFENGIDENWKAKFVWLAVDTPVDDKDRPDVRPLKEIVQRVELTQKAVKHLCELPGATGIWAPISRATEFLRATSQRICVWGTG